MVFRRFATHILVLHLYRPHTEWPRCKNEDYFQSTNAPQK